VVSESPCGCSHQSHVDVHHGGLLNCILLMSSVLHNHTGASIQARLRNRLLDHFYSAFCRINEDSSHVLPRLRWYWIVKLSGENNNSGHGFALHHTSRFFLDQSEQWCFWDFLVPNNEHQRIRNAGRGWTKGRFSIPHGLNRMEFSPFNSTNCMEHQKIRRDYVQDAFRALSDSEYRIAEIPGNLGKARVSRYTIGDVTLSRQCW
jgi:hypothetical protein